MPETPGTYAMAPGPDWSTDGKLPAVAAISGFAIMLTFLRLCRRRRASRTRAVAPKLVACAAAPPSATDLPAKNEHLVPTAQELSQVEKLRQRVQLSDAAKRLQGIARWFEDFELLRFVRARDTLAEAEQLFNEAAMWRHGKQNTLGSALIEGSFGATFASWESGTETPPAWYSFLGAHMPQFLYGADEHGLPIMYSGVGRTDFLGCEREVGYEAFERFAMMMNDRFLDAARAEGAGKRGVVHGGVVIVNLEGLALRHLRDVSVFKKLSAAAKILHPERQRKCFVINAPSAFAAVWRLLRPVIDARTAARMTIFSSGESLEPLMAEIGSHNLPDFLGGSFTGLRCPKGGLVQPGSFAKWQASA